MNVLRTLLAVAAILVFGAGMFWLGTITRLDSSPATLPGREQPNETADDLAGDPAAGPTVAAPAGDASDIRRADVLLLQAQLQEAQDLYLRVLVTGADGGARAMRGLVQIRRRLAGDDPGKLRREAAAYQAAARQGLDTGEHYTPAAMVLLAKASTRAADELEAGDGAARAPGPPAPERPPAPEPKPDTARPRSPRPGQAAEPRERPAPTPPRPREPAGSAARPQPRPAAPPAIPQTPPPAPPAPMPAPPAPPPAPEPPEPRDEPLLMAYVGPIADRDRAAELATALTLEGYTARITTRAGEPERFVVVSEPMAKAVADQRIRLLESLGFRVTRREQADGSVVLEFGAFGAREQADDLARRVRRRGFYAATVAEGGAAYVVAVGPHRRPMIEALTRRLGQSGYLVTVVAAE